MPTKIQISVPDKGAVISAGIPVSVAPLGYTWSEGCLGNLRRQKGVYVIHHGGVVKYVGKTDGVRMSFGIRLRRHFQESASQRKHMYPRWRGLETPPSIEVTLINFQDIRSRISGAVTSAEGPLIRLYEATLIAVYDPEYQQASFRRGELRPSGNDIR